MAAAAPAAFRLEARRRDRRERLLAAGLGLFAERGFHETSVDDVVAAARTSKSAFYDYFDSKEDCFRVLLEREGGELMAIVQLEAASESGPRARIGRGIAAFVAACAAQAPAARLLLVESVGLSTSVEAVRHRLHGRFAGMVEAEVRRGQAQGEFRGTDPVVFGRSVVGAVNEAVSCFLREGGRGPESLARSLCEIFGL